MIPLNPKLFDTDVEQAPIRQGFGEGLVLEIDGHNMASIVDAVDQARAIFEKPSVIIAHTIPGKGVEMFESDPRWHGNPPNKEQGANAMEELRTLGGQIQSEHE